VILGFPTDYSMLFAYLISVQGFCTWSKTMKKVDNLKIYSQENCTAIYGKGPTNGTICAGNPERLEGICDVSRTQACKLYMLQSTCR